MTTDFLIASILVFRARPAPKGLGAAARCAVSPSARQPPPWSGLQHPLDFAFERVDPGCPRTCGNRQEIPPSYRGEGRSEKFPDSGWPLPGPCGSARCECAAARDELWCGRWGIEKATMECSRGPGETRTARPVAESPGAVHRECAAPLPEAYGRAGRRAPACVPGNIECRAPEAVGGVPLDRAEKKTSVVEFEPGPVRGCLRPAHSSRRSA